MYPKSPSTFLGFEADEVLSGGAQFVMDLIHLEDQGRVMKENQEALEFIQTNKEFSDSYWKDFKYRIKRKDGEYIWIKTRGGRAFEFDQYGQVEKIINFSKEITNEELFTEVNEEIEVPHGFEDLKNEYCHHLNNSLQIIQYLQNEINPEYQRHLENTFKRLLDIGNRLQRI